MTQSGYFMTIVPAPFPLAVGPKVRYRTHTAQCTRPSVGKNLDIDPASFAGAAGIRASRERPSNRAAAVVTLNAASEETRNGQSCDWQRTIL